MGYLTILHPAIALAEVNRPVSAPITIPVPIPVLVAPEMVYPADRQILDLEGAYIFKVTQIPSASGYLFGLFQDNVLIYENLRDTRTLSPNGEFTLLESNPAHVRFHAGTAKVIIRALVNGRWTNAREITIVLRPRSAVPSPAPVFTPVPTPIGIGTTNRVGIGITSPVSISTVRRVGTGKIIPVKPSVRRAIKSALKSARLTVKKSLGK